MNILLIDDDPLDRMWTIQSLARAGLRGDVTEAATLREASDLLDKRGFDCALVDCFLPDGTVFDLLAVDEGTRCAIIVLTGSDDQQLGTDASKAGAWACLVKGKTEPALLAERVRSAIASWTRAADGHRRDPGQISGA